MYFRDTLSILFQLHHTNVGYLDFAPTRPGLGGSVVHLRPRCGRWCHGFMHGLEPAEGRAI